MFKQISGRQMPVGNQIEEMRIRPASLGGGFIMELVVGGKVETMVFPSQQAMSQTMFTMFNAAAIAQMAAAPAAPAAAQPAPVSAAVTQEALAKIASEAKARSVEPVKLDKKRGGRPKGSKNKPKVVDAEKLPASAEEDTVAKAA